MNLNDDYKNILLAFEERGVKYLLVGDYADAVFGKTRPNMDLDVWVMPDPKNAPLVLKALKDIGAPAGYLTAKDMQKEGIDFQIGLPPRKIRILTSVTGLKFNDALAKAKKAELDGVPVLVLAS